MVIVIGIIRIGIVSEKKIIGKMMGSTPDELATPRQSVRKSASVPKHQSVVAVHSVESLLQLV
jgi:hypothetical protein